MSPWRCHPSGPAITYSWGCPSSLVTFPSASVRRRPWPAWRPSSTPQKTPSLERPSTPRSSAGTMAPKRIYGYTATEAIGQPIGMLLPPGSEDEVPAIMERIRRGENVEHDETKRQRKGGPIIDVSVAVSPIKTPDGDVIGASAVARDVTE